MSASEDVVDDLEELLGAPIGFEHIQTFRAGLVGVFPNTVKGLIEVRFNVYTLDVTALAGLIAAAGKMLEVGVAQKVWSSPESDEPT